MTDFSENVSFTITADGQLLARLVVALVDAGQPITAVRVLKDALHCGLKQGKDIVDVARNMPRSRPTAFVVGAVQEAIDRYCGV